MLEPKKLLLTVEGAVSLSERGEILITPFIPSENKPKSTETSVFLKLPDGTTRVVDAIFGFVYDLKEHHVCILRGITKEEIEAGTEVWIYE
jgi:hypothetical protein